MAKRFRIRWILLVLVFAAAAIRAEEAPPAREVPVLADAPNLDGRLIEPAWSRAPRVAGFIAVRHADRPIPAPTEARILADGTHLWVGFLCKDRKTETLVAGVTEAGGPVYRDDSVEFFLDPGHDMTSLVQVIVNTRGAVFQKGSGVLYAPAGGDFGVEAAAHVDGGEWSVEIRVPLARVGLSLAAFLRAPNRPFLMNFSRNLRNPAYREETEGNAFYCASAKGYFDRAGFARFRFVGERPDLVVRGDQPDRIENALATTLAFQNTGDDAFGLRVVTELPDHPAPRDPLVTEMNLPPGATEVVNVAADTMEAGEHRARVTVHRDGRLLFVRELVFALDEAVEIAPTFPCRSIEGGEKTFRLLVAPYILEDADRYRLSVQVLKDVLPVLTREWDTLQPVLPVPFTESFDVLVPGRYRIRAILREGETPVYANAFTFYKGRSTLPVEEEALLIRNWGFEEVTGKRPRLWRKEDLHAPASVYPAGWSIAKKAAYWTWGDLARSPRSVYEGERSVILKGYGPGAQLHFRAPFIAVEPGARYAMRLVARGRGRLSVRYYIQNKNRRWMGRYYDSRRVELTDDWREYRFDPVPLSLPIERSWSGQPLEATAPVRAAPIVWIHDQGKAYLDNVLLYRVK